MPNQNQPSDVALGIGLVNERIIGAMMAAFQAADDRSLAECLIIGLEAGFAAWGEPYPLRSAAINIARPGVPLLPIDLRVDCSDAPIPELRRTSPMGWGVMALWLRNVHTRRCDAFPPGRTALFRQRLVNQGIDERSVAPSLFARHLGHEDHCKVLHRIGPPECPVGAVPVELP